MLRMTNLPYMPLNVNDFLADTQELSNEETGAYIRLHCALWRSNGYLPAEQLGRFARAGKRWGVIAPAILTKLTIFGGLASCGKLLGLLLRTKERHARAVDKGRKGGILSGKIRQIRASAVAFAPTQIRPLNGDKPLESLNRSEPGLRPSLKLEASNQKREERKKESSDEGLEALVMRSMAPIETAIVLPEAVTNADGWLYREGVAMLMERAGLRRGPATAQISRWRSALRDPEEVATILAAAEYENLRGPPFVAVIDQKVKTLRSEKERGLPLPFGFQPNVVRR
jgi:hypothetical protein